MRRIAIWLKSHFKTFDLVPVYFEQVYDEWQDILWGTSLPAVAFFLWWTLGLPRNTAILCFFVCFLFVAGYYVWRVDHVRLIPKFTVDQFEVQPTPMVDRLGFKTGTALYYQLLPKCSTDANVENCRGMLTAIQMWNKNENRWMPVEREVMFLEWSHGALLGPSKPTTLYAGGEQRLNVFCIHSPEPKMRLCVEPFPARFISLFEQLALNTTAIRFDIQVSADNCPTVRLSMKVQLTGDPFRPIVDLEQRNA